MCSYKQHYCKSCRKDYDCPRHDLMCPTLNDYEDKNICEDCIGDRLIEEHVFKKSLEPEFFEDEEFDENSDR